MKPDLRSLARLATGVENRDPAALAALDAMAPGHARIVGVTGPPGAGKSTLVDALAVALRKQGKTVAILAIDPSSRIHGGAILGDRIRMQQHHADPGIFIRSMATRGNAGGIAAATADVARLMSAAGRDYVLIETVGVGQDEIEVARVAQVTIVVLVPGMGDDIQAIKAGIMEIGDVFVINKADRDGVLRTEKELEALLSLAMRSDFWMPPIVKTVATENTGIEALATAIQSYKEYLENNQASQQRREEIARWRILELLSERLLAQTLSGQSASQLLERLSVEVASKYRDPYSAVDEIIASVRGVEG